MRLAVAEGLGLVVARDFAMPYRGRFVRLAERDGDGGGQGDDCRRARPSGRSASSGPWPMRLARASPIACSSGLAFRSTRRCRRRASWSPIGWRTALLLPRRWFAADGRELDWDLLELKERYSTASHELIARRMLEMRPPIVITVCDLGRVHWRRSNVTARPPSMLPEETAVWRESHETGLPADETLDAETGLESVRCWPIHEPGWKREILRSEIAEF